MNETWSYRPTPLSIIVLFLILLVVGTLCAFRIPVRLSPVAQENLARITFGWPTASPHAVESEVTSRLEGVLGRVSGVESISSISSSGYGSLEVRYKEGVDRDMLQFTLASCIRQVFPGLPEGVSYPLLSGANSGREQEPILIYTVYAPVGLSQVHDQLQSSVVPVLRTIPGVGDVLLEDAPPRTVAITLPTESTHALGVTAMDISQAVSAHLRIFFAGHAAYQKNENERATELSIQIQPRRDSIDWRKIPVKKIGDRLVCLGDVAQVHIREQPSSSYFRINGTDAINLTVFAENGASLLQVSEAVRKAMERSSKLLPSGYTVMPPYDHTTDPATSFRRILWQALAALAGLVVFLAATRRGMRYAIMFLSCLLANVGLACIVYSLCGVVLRPQTFAAINAALVLTAGTCFLSLSKEPRRSWLGRCFPFGILPLLTVAAALTTIFLLSPLQQTEPAAFAQVIIIHMVVAWVVAATLAPVLRNMLQGPERPIKFGGCYLSTLRIQNYYHLSLAWIQRRRVLLVLVIVLAFGIPLRHLPEQYNHPSCFAKVYNSTIGSVFFRDYMRPTLQSALGGTLQWLDPSRYPPNRTHIFTRPMLEIRARTPIGSTLTQLNDVMLAMEHIVAQCPAVAHYTTSISDSYHALMSIRFLASYENSHVPLALKQSLEATAATLSGATWSIDGIGPAFSNDIMMSTYNNEIILEGYHYPTLYRYAEMLETHLHDSPRVKGVSITFPGNTRRENGEEVYVKFDREALAASSSIANIYALLQRNVHNQEVASVSNNLSVSVETDDYNSFDIWAFRNQPLQTSTGAEMRLDGMASIARRNGSMSIFRRDQQYQIAIRYEFVGSYTLSNAFQLQQLDRIGRLLPLGYRTMRSRVQEWDASSSRPYYLIGLALAIVTAICAIQLESLGRALAVMAVLPVAFIGAFTLCHIFGIGFEPGTFTGLILLCGVAPGYALNCATSCTISPRDDASGNYNFLASLNKVTIPVLATGLGMIPFICLPGSAILYSFALTILGGLGGLLPALFYILPVFMPTYKPNL